MKVLDFVANCERIQAVLELKQSFDGLELQQPVSDTKPHGDGDADSHEKIKLNIATPEFKTKIVDIMELIRRADKGLFWSDDEIVERYYQESIISEHWLDTREFDSSVELPTYWGTRITKRFGGIIGLIQYAREKYGRDAVKNLDEKADAWQIPKDMLLERYYRESKKQGHWITAREMKRYGSWLSMNIINKNFGKLSSLRQEASDLFGELEYQKNSLQTQLQITDDMIIEAYYQRSLEIGRWISYNDLRRTDFDFIVGNRAITTRFGSIVKLRGLVIAKYGNIEPKTAGRGGKRAYTNTLSLDQMVELFYQESLKEGHWLTNREIRQNGLVPFVVVEKNGGHAKLVAHTIERYGDLPKTTN